LKPEPEIDDSDLVKDGPARLAPTGAWVARNSRHLEKLSAIEKNFDLDRYAGEVTRRFFAESEAEVRWIEHLRRISN